MPPIADLLEPLLRDGVLFQTKHSLEGVNPLFPALRSGPTTASGASRQKKIPSSCVAETGRSPMKHVSHLRMQQACHLLLDRRQTLEEVSEGVGYASQFSFSKAFHAHTGLRPSAFRKQNS